MKKRIALGAVIVTAVAVTGMFPAFAVKPGAPAVGSELCARAGGSVEARSNTGNIVVRSDGTTLTIDGGGCDQATFLFSGLTAVAIETDGYGVEFKLEKGTDDVFANYHDVPFTVQASTFVRFNAASMTASLRNAVGTVTEEAFTVGSLTGTYFAGARVEFDGGNGGDVFDASAVVSTSVDASGGPGADVLRGGAEGDTLTGGTGNDQLFGNAGDDALAVNGDGSLTIERGHSGKYTVVSVPSGADEAWGGIGNDIINGDLADSIAPGDGSDEINGNISTLAYFDSATGITVNLVSAAGVVKSASGDDYYGGSVDAFVGSDFADTFVGNGAQNAFYGQAGADIFMGGAGNDEIGGGGGPDAVKGQAGADLIFGDSGPDTINGGSGDDVIWMGVGDDIAYGSAGDDVLRGQEGLADQAWGGKDSDICAAEVTNRCEFTK